MVFKEKSKKSSKRLKIDEEAGKITIYKQDKVSLQEILPYLIKPKRAFKHFRDKSLKISWSAIQANLPTRS